MPPNMDAYEKLVVQEDRLVKRVCTCEGTTNTILYVLFQRGKTISLSICRYMAMSMMYNFVNIPVLEEINKSRGCCYLIR
ncbi:hypothetical protein [Paenibacillus sp. Aloe-11]|uniref:hypothetical protein n=1 Tax=Paenibacillus sp. Aloe-11 TaxID=1050222 RepID=UPI00024EFA6D|nr:hypothetical protein [Paenibacillus sp. Aloe-11]EHS54843.1 hypothetical protein WG8_5199 [Paenibacillus sp. Aloe-11]